jgi:hypothetical protein
VIPATGERRLAQAGIVLLSVVALLAAHGIAEAHEIIPGVTGIASLALHPFVAVDLALVLVAATLLAAGRGNLPSLATGAVIVGLAAVPGLLLQPHVVAVPGLWRWPLVIAALSGAWLATGLVPPRAILVLAALACGLCLGIGVPPERSGPGGLIEAALGISLAVSVGFTLLGIPRVLLSSPVVALAARIAGSWIAAIAVMALVALSR